MRWDGANKQAAECSFLEREVTAGRVFKGLSQVVLEGPREEEVKHGPVSFERQSLKPTKGERQRDR